MTAAPDLAVSEVGIVRGVVVAMRGNVVHQSVCFLNNNTSVVLSVMSDLEGKTGDTRVTAYIHKVVFRRMNSVVFFGTGGERPNASLLGKVTYVVHTDMLGTEAV